ncbi:MAG: pseudaminic acid synthase [Magnetospirillum sp.]|nr:pseudaminic acid synthase [Magnetospirillum sp.]
MSLAPSPTLAIAGRPIGPDHPPFIIAEMSANHNGDLGRALDLLEAAAKAGADAVKLQTLKPDAITIDHDGPGFVIEGGPWDGRKLFDLYSEAQTPWEWHEALFRRGRELGVIVFSSPFDKAAVDFLADLGAPAFKIASFEMADPDLVGHAAGKGKPIIVSTGLAGLGDIAATVETVRRAGNPDLILLHCISSYPAPTEDANLATIPHMAEAFGVPVGLSDHTQGTAVAVAAVALGACVIEKHVTLRRADGGLDSHFSLEPEELAQLVRDCRAAWVARGRVSYLLEESEEGSRAFRRSLYVVDDLAAGEVITEAKVRSIRPGFGLEPKFLSDVLGRKARRAVTRGTPFDWSMID